MARRFVAIVTGAARGIGQATARALGEQGWTVVGADLKPSSTILECDVCSVSSVAALVDSTVEKYGHLDGLVNAAGIGFPEPFLEASDETWQRVLDVNLMGTVRLCRSALPHLRVSTYEARGIVNFTSQAAKTGGLLIGAHYCAAKAAVMCLTFSLAREFGPEGIRVNAVAPGIIETPFLERIPGIRERGLETPLRRVGQPSEAASVVAWLLSPAASYLTGEVVDVNGGLHMD
jgi:NAD(P)-dependent dehydrogenase (short-subunit alcohol dehydrogenase family)